MTKDWWAGSSLGEASAYYRPLAEFTFWLNRLIGGNTSTSYHIGNLALHAGAVVLLMVWLRRCLASAAHSNEVRVRAEPDRSTNPWLVSALGVWFAVCAINSEAVVWISGRCEAVGVCFALGAFLLNASSTRWKNILGYGLALAAALSKEPFIAVPLLLVAQDVLVLRRPRAQWLMRAVAALAVVGGYFAIRRLVGVPTGSAAASVGLWSAICSFVFLVAAMVPLVALVGHFDAAHLYRVPSVPVVLLVSAVLLVITLVLARRANRGSRLAGVATFGWLVFLAALAPAALANAAQGFMGERYFYFPLAGLMLTCACALSLVRNARVIVVGVSVAALAQMPFTMLRVRDWVDEETLFRSSVDADPHNGYALAALADIEARRGSYDNAEQHLVTARADGWQDHSVEVTSCFVYMHQKRHALAEDWCARATRSKPGDPRAWLNLASEYVNEGKNSDAEGSASNAIQLKPSYAEAYFIRGLARSRDGQIDLARADFNKTLELNPAHPQAAQALRTLP